MSEIVDEELLGGEDELEGDYDISNEREEALLQEEEEYSTNRKKSVSFDDSFEPDVLDLDLDVDIDEDFEEDEKLLNEEEEPEEKKDNKLVERPNNAVVAKPKPLTTTAPPKRPTPPTKTVNKTVVPQREYNAKPIIRNDHNWKRGNGRNFQTRQNFNKNNLQRRRNGTVLINPRYEGTVHVNDNNARLAWDSTQQSPNNSNFVRPWSSSNNLGNCDPNLLVTNIMTGIANTLAHPSSNMLLSGNQAQNQTFYEPPPTYKPPPNTYKPQLAFEPPPHIAQNQHMQKPFSNYNQASNHQMAPPVNTYPRNTQYNNNQMPRMQTMYNKPYSNFNNYNHNNSGQEQKRSPNLTPVRYENQNFNYKNTGPTYTGNYSQQNDFQDRNTGYLRNNDYQNQNRNQNYGNYKERNYNNYSQNYEQNSPVENNIKPVLQNPTYRPNNKFQNMGSQENTFPNKQTNYNFDYQRDNSDFSSNRSNNFTQQKFGGPINNNYSRQNDNFARPNNRRPALNSSYLKNDLPEKKPRANEQEEEKEEAKTVKNSQEVPDEEEDEETRLYRLKIEEQKREREKVLKIKEERRKQMLEQRQQQEKQLLLPESGTVLQSKQNLSKPGQFQSKNLQNPSKSGQFKGYSDQGDLRYSQLEKKTFGGFNAVDTPNVQRGSTQYVLPKKQISRPPNVLSQPNYPHESNFSEPDSEFSDDLNLTFKVSNVVQPTSKNETSSTGFMSNRVVVVKSKTNQKSGLLANSDVNKPVPVVTEPCNESSEVSGLSSFFNNRKVLKKDNSLLNTRLVVVNNLSTSINHDKLMALSRGIGEIE